MIKKYNIALVPASKNNNIIEYAQYFSNISDQYQLGNRSLPHVTLCHFQSKESEIDSLWHHACEALPEKFIHLEFKEFSCITINNIFWVSLMPNQRTELFKMHQRITSAMNMPINKFYDPHMTLISTKYNTCKKMTDELSKSYLEISDVFFLSLGERDSIGQFTKLIYKCEFNKIAQI